MAKYSYEFKMEIIQAYLKGEGGYGYFSRRYGISAQRNIAAWVHA